MNQYGIRLRDRDLRRISKEQRKAMHKIAKARIAALRASRGSQATIQRASK